jgi:uncharacterized membrane protein
MKSQRKVVLTRIVWAIMGAMAVTAIAYWARFGYFLGYSFSTDPRTWAEFGNYFSGILTPIFAAAAFIAAFVAFNQEKDNRKFEQKFALVRETLHDRARGKFPTGNPGSLLMTFLSQADRIAESTEANPNNWAALETSYLNLDFFKECNPVNWVYAVKNAITLIASEEPDSARHTLKQFLVANLEYYEWHYLVAHCLSWPQSRFALACKSIGLLENNHHLYSPPVEYRLRQFDFK